MKRRIALISTGGTIEKTYDELSGVLANHVSVLDVMLVSLELRGVEVQRVSLMNKDSLEMSPEDHTLIAESAGRLARETDGVVVVHGTDRLAASGDRVVELVGTPASPIVFTGAMRPYELRSTDALQNLTEALLAVQLVAPGVYVAMHNQVLQFPGVTKDKVLGTFVKADGSGMITPVRDLAFLMPALLDALGASGTAVIVVAEDGTGEIVRWYANAPAASILGYTLEELYQVPVMETIHPQQRQLMLQLSQSFRAGQAVPAAIELQLVHKDGTALPCEAAIGSFSLGGIRLYATVMRVAGAYEQELSLLESDRIGLVGALAAGFAHEINNPLTSVLLNLRSLRKQLAALPDAAQPAALRCVDDITLGAERIASNVRALQTLATRSGTQEIDLAGLVTSALRLAAPTIEPRAQVVRHIQAVRMVTGEESRIGQAVLAMLLFSGSGFPPDVSDTSHRIVVAVEQRDKDIVVEVSDNGHDLSAEEVRGAFDPFFRSSARGAGVGVGLGVARSVATTLRGEVTLAPRPGGGAVITMRLPAAAT